MRAIPLAGRAALLALALAWTTAAQAALVELRFDGSVMGLDAPWRDPSTLNSFPAGTASSFDIRFDDAALAPASLISGPQLSSVEGALTMGATTWTITSGRAQQVVLNPDGSVDAFKLAFRGTGPVVDAGTFFALEIVLDTNLDPVWRGIPPIVAALSYPVPIGSVRSVGAVELAGDFQAAAVPEPTTAALLLLPLAWLGARRWRRRGA